jgi:L-ascorbate oxidase
MKMPSTPLMLAKDKIDDSAFCNATSLAESGIDCTQVFCECSHVLQVRLNSVVEMLLVDEGMAYDANHPFHLHGNAFRVVAMERLARNITIEEVGDWLFSFAESKLFSVM